MKQCPCSKSDTFNHRNKSHNFFFLCAEAAAQKLRDNRKRTKPKVNLSPPKLIMLAFTLFLILILNVFSLHQQHATT